MTTRVIEGDELSSYWTPPAPRELPALRQAIADHLLTPAKIEGTAEAITNGLGTLYPRHRSPGTGALMMLREERDRLKEASLFYVDAQMTENAHRAAALLPDFHLEPHHLPAETGFILFAGAIGSYVMNDFATAVGGPGRAHVVAVSWGPTALLREFHPSAPETCVWLTFWTATNYPRMRRIFTEHMGCRSADADRRARLFESELTWDNETLVWFGEPMSLNELELVTKDGEETLGPWVQRLRAAWLLMTQPNYAETEVHEPSRQQRRRAESDGYRNNAVTVVKIRPRPRRSGGARTGTGTPWGVRTVVRPHWRQQVCGPGRSERRPTFIDSHPAGDPDAPLSANARVYLLAGQARPEELVPPPGQP